MGKTREYDQEIDKKLTAAERRNIARAEKASKIPFLPNQGGTVAGFTDTQMDAFGMGDQAASAFGFTPTGYQRPDHKVEGGIVTHSPHDWYEDMKNQSVTPGMQKYIDSFFVNPNNPGGGGGGGRKRLNPFGGNNIFGQGGPMETNAGDGNSQYGGGAGWSRDPYDDPISSGHKQYGTDRSFGNRAVSAAGNAWSNSLPGRAVDIAGGGSGAGTGGGGGK